MIQIILFTTLLYLVQIMLPNLVKSRFGENVSESASRAVNNLRESMSVFFVLAVLSIQLNVEANTMIALIWLVLRIVFVLIYVSGFNAKPANEAGKVVQPIRSLVWVISIVCLYSMGINLF